MANKNMSFLNIGDETFEVVDEQARDDIASFNGKLEDLKSDLLITDEITDTFTLDSITSHEVLSETIIAPFHGHQYRLIGIVAFTINSRRTEGGGSSDQCGICGISISHGSQDRINIDYVYYDDAYADQEHTVTITLTGLYLLVPTNT